MTTRLGGLGGKAKVAKEIPTCSMADIAFLLLIFFMVTTDFRTERDRPIAWTAAFATKNIDENITIAPTTFRENPVSELPPPPTQAKNRTEDLAAAPVFTPYTVRPDIKNRDEVQRALEREYPPLLRDAGIGGTVLVWFFVDETGLVQRTLVKEGSGHHALGEAALKVADVIQFTPALNRDKRVPVWIALPINFTVR